MTADDATRNAAAAWAVRTRDPDFDDWSAFTAWLEEDQKNSSAYDAVLLAADDAAKLMTEDIVPPRSNTIELDSGIAAANDEDYSPTWSIDRRWLGGAIAASIVAVFALGLSLTGSSVATYQTNPGETLAIDLEDGARIELGGGSEIALSGENGRLVTLVGGQATFSVEPGDHAPFEVTAGSDTIVDIGTIFDVRLDGSQLQVEVLEGAVLVNPDTRNLRLSPGQSLTKDGSSYSVGDVALDSVGEWRMGRVTFRSATVDDVARRLSRSTGIAFSTSASGSATFSGSVLVEPIKADPASVGPLLGLEVREAESGWVLSTP